MATGGASGTIPNKQTQILNAAFQELQAHPLPYIKDLQLEVVDRLNQLSGIIIGPEGSDYAGGHFNFLITFPPQYPFKLPEIFIRTPIYHPNIEFKTGVVCLDRLTATYNPRKKLTEILDELHALLAEPNYEIPIDDNLTGGESREDSRIKAREYTAAEAKPSNQ